MNGDTQRPHWLIIYAACLVVIFGVAWSSTAEAQSFGGRAFAAYVNVPTVGVGPLYLVDTGPLPTAGGWQSADLIGAQVPSALSADVLNAATVGGDYGNGSSSSSLANMTVLPGNVAQVTASFIYSEALATAGGTGGSTQVYDLTFGGVPVQVTGAPNQQVQIPGLLGPVATLIINEQTATSNATSQSITVNALHLILATGEEVIVGSASSLVNIPTAQANLPDGHERSKAMNRVPGAQQKVTAARSMARAGLRAQLPSDGTIRLASLNALSVPAGSVRLASAGGSLAAPGVRSVLPRVRSGDYCSSNTNPLQSLLWKFGVRPRIILAWGPPPECFDFVTYGGFFFGTSDGSGRINFGGNAGYKNGPPPPPLMVHVNVVDDNLGRHVKIQDPLSPTSYGPSSFFGTVCQCRRFQGPGTSTINGVTTSVTADVEVCDKGEPGNAPKGSDTFAIQLHDSTGAAIYTAIGNPIIGGNVQLHKTCPLTGCP